MVLRAKFFFDAADRMAEAVAQWPLSAGFLHTDQNFQLRLGKLRVAFLSEVHHVAILRWAKPPACVLIDGCATCAFGSTTGLTVCYVLFGQLVIEQRADG